MKLVSENEHTKINFFISTEWDLSLQNCMYYSWAKQIDPHPDRVKNVLTDSFCCKVFSPESFPKRKSCNEMIWGAPEVCVGFKDLENRETPFLADAHSRGFWGVVLVIEGVWREWDSVTFHHKLLFLSNPRLHPSHNLISYIR